jgi:hypothetical protein
MRLKALCILLGAGMVAACLAGCAGSVRPDSHAADGQDTKIDSSATRGSVPPATDSNYRIMIQYKKGVSELEKEHLRSEFGVVLVEKIKSVTTSSAPAEGDLEVVEPSRMPILPPEIMVRTISRSSKVDFAEINDKWFLSGSGRKP